MCVPMMYVGVSVGVVCSSVSLVAQDSVMAGPEFYDDLTAALDPDRREAFVLTQLARLQLRRAQRVIGCPIGAVRSRVSRAVLTCSRCWSCRAAEGAEPRCGGGGNYRSWSGDQ